MGYAIRKASAWAAAFFLAVPLSAGLGHRGEPDVYGPVSPQPGDAWELQPQRLAQIPGWRLEWARHLRTQSYANQGFDSVGQGAGVVASLGPWGSLGVSGRSNEFSNITPGLFLGSTDTQGHYLNAAWGRALGPNWSLGLSAGGGKGLWPAGGGYDRHLGAGLGYQFEGHQAGYWSVRTNPSDLWINGASLEGPLVWGHGYRGSVLLPQSATAQWQVGLEVREGPGVHVQLRDGGYWLLGLGWVRSPGPRRGNWGFRLHAVYSAEQGLKGGLGLNWQWARVDWGFGDRVSEIRAILQTPPKPDELQ